MGICWYIDSIVYGNINNLIPRVTSTEQWSYNEWETDPSTGLAWTREGLNAASIQLLTWVGYPAGRPTCTAIYVKVECTRNR
jgi:hypothetical protein